MTTGIDNAILWLNCTVTAARVITRALWHGLLFSD
jgi:hypothetical protein